jgi:hypothetical protein
MVPFAAGPAPAHAIRIIPAESVLPAIREAVPDAPAPVTATEVGTVPIEISLPPEIFLAAATVNPPLAWIIHEISSQERKDALKG